MRASMRRGTSTSGGGRCSMTMSSIASSRPPTSRIVAAVRRRPGAAGPRPARRRRRPVLSAGAAGLRLAHLQSPERAGTFLDGRPSQSTGVLAESDRPAAAWEMDFWGRFRRGIELADAALLASIATYDDVLVSLTGDVATNYVQIRTLDARLRIAHDNVEVQRESLNIAEIRFRGGTTSERDVEQARTVLASTEATIPQLATALQQTKNSSACCSACRRRRSTTCWPGRRVSRRRRRRSRWEFRRSCCDVGRT